MTAHPVTEIELLQDTAHARPVPPVLVLAWHEGRRMLLHPLLLVAVAWWAFITVRLNTHGPRDAFEMVTSAVTFMVGVPAYFAANLVASRDRRAHSEELLAAQPVREQVRTWALCLGCLVPAAAVMALVAVAHAVMQAAGRYLFEPWTSHLLMGPTTVLGGALLGVMVARWLPVPGAAALVMVAMVAWNVWATNRPSGASPLGTYMSWPKWGSGGSWVGLEPGSPRWHIAYLLGLCAMAWAGALLPGTASRWRVLVVGAVLTALTAYAGWAQIT